MAIAHSHLQAAGRILSGYAGKMPFPEHARAYFRANKQHGGRDRKAISAICYAVLRLGASLDDHSLEARAVAGLFLMLDAPDRTLQELDPIWSVRLPMPLNEKIALVKERHPSFDTSKIFCWANALGGGMNAVEFTLSHLVQPALFVRIRPGKKIVVTKALDTVPVQYEKVGESALKLPQGLDLSSLFMADRELVIQDLSSQRVATLMDATAFIPASIWDCCAGSGGKSILFHDLYPEARISASDIRPGILHNLRTRLETAGISGAQIFPADLEQRPLKGHGLFDLVIADVPCSGSGTWGRNPEWLTWFDAAAIPEYSRRQMVIARHAAKAVKPGGHFLYITCSVFREENEAVVESLEKESGLRLEEMKYLVGYAERADTLFAARFILPA